MSRVERIPDDKALALLRRGVKLRDGMTAPAGARLVRVSIGAWSLDGLRPGKWEVRR